MIGLTQDIDVDGLREIGEQVHALYSRGPFGRVLKTEIDGVLFRAYARHQHRLKRGAEEFRWYHLGPQDVRDLSIRLRINQSRVETLLEHAALADGIRDLDTTEIIAIIQRLASKTHQDKKDLDEAKLRLFVTNRVLRSYIEAFLLQGGGIPETSFHRGHLVIRLGDLLLAATRQGDDMEQFLATVARACKSYNRILAKAEFSEALNQKTPGEVAGQAAKVIMNKVLGDGGGDLMKDLFGVVSATLKSEEN
jgi:hypothetical protein